ncbi:MAG: hypothetical protein WCB67_03905, partial [Solirubrobacteraceae bacterium]
TESLVQQCGDDVRQGASTIQQELEGLGSANLYFVDLAGFALPALPPPKPTLPRRLGETLGVGFRGLPTVLGLRRSRRTPSARQR